MDYGIPPSSLGHKNGVDIELMKNTIQTNLHKDILFGDFNQLDIKYNFIDYEHGEFEGNSSSSVLLSKDTHDFKVQLQSPNSIFIIHCVKRIRSFILKLEKC